MTDQNKNAPDADKPDEAAANGQGGFAHTEPANDQGQPSEEDVLLRLAKENEELKDRALRIAAEMENLRKRTARDVHEARSYSIANFARDMLGVADNLRRALEAVPQENGMVPVGKVQTVRLMGLKPGQTYHYKVVSTRVVKIFRRFSGSPTMSNSTSLPSLRPIQAACMRLVESGQSKSFNPSSKRSA